MRIKRHNYESVCTAKNLSDFGQTHTNHGYNSFRDTSKSELAQAIRSEVDELKVSGDGMVTAIINSTQTVAHQVFRDFGFGESEWCYSRKHRETPTKLFWVPIQDVNLTYWDSVIQGYLREEGRGRNNTSVRPVRGEKWIDEWGVQRDSTIPMRGNRSKVRFRNMEDAVSKLRGEEYTEGFTFVPDRVLTPTIGRRKPVTFNDGTGATVPVNINIIPTYELDDIPTYRLAQRYQVFNRVVGNHWNRYRFTSARAARRFAWWLVENGHISNES